MSFLDNLENDLKNMESREDRGPRDSRDRRRQDSERAHAQESAVYAEQLRKGPYTADLLRLAIYARSLLTNQRLREYMDQHHPEIVGRFETIIADARG